jgi:NAD(P)-dependent dehydrogenase (short-subunit alcohol dehydrogenase family)
MVKHHKTAVVTGSCGLLGRSIVSKLIDDGWHVIGIDICDFVPVLAGYDHIKFDLGNTGEFCSLKGMIMNRVESINCLVNNAANNPKVEGEPFSGSFETMTMDEWSKDLLINLTSPVMLTKCLLPLFPSIPCVPQNKIINIISTYGLVAPNQAIYSSLGECVNKPISYCASKAGLAMVTKYLATLLGEENFGVNGVAPGGIQNNQPYDFVRDYSALTPMGRMASVGEVSSVVKFLCSQESNYINGQIIAVDGGWTAW